MGSFFNKFFSVVFDVDLGSVVSVLVMTCVFCGVFVFVGSAETRRILGKVILLFMTARVDRVLGLRALC